MTYENFLRVTLSLQKQERLIKDLDNLNVDLFTFVDPYHGIIYNLIKEIYGAEGADMFSWFCYDNDFGQNGLDNFDKAGNRICFSHESLWAYLESLRKVFTNEASFTFERTNEIPDSVPYHTVCGCSNCDCRMRDKRIPNPVKYSYDIGIYRVNKNKYNNE